LRKSTTSTYLLDRLKPIWRAKELGPLAVNRLPAPGLHFVGGLLVSGNFSRFFCDHMGVTPSRFRRAATRTAPHLLTGVS
jgi:hypothetical protein